MFDLTGIGFGLIILGIIVAVFAFVLMLTTSRGDGKTRSAGILLIGPIPIMFGTDRESVRLLAVLAVVIIIIVLVFMLLPSLLVGR